MAIGLADNFRRDGWRGAAGWLALALPLLLAVSFPTPAARAASADVQAFVYGPDTAPASGTVVYSVTLTNLGSGSATSVILKDTLGTGVTFVSATGGGTNNAGVVTWPTFASIASGVGFTYTVTVTAPASGSFTNTLTSTASSSDPDASNNNGTSSDGAVETAVTPYADVRTTLSAAATVMAGSTLVYTIAVTNAGPDTATNVAVRTTVMPATTTFYSASGGGADAGGGVVNWPGFNLASGATTNLTLTVVAPTSGSLTLSLIHI
jgi:uncharacterized repeat protein (TIGR01451 family)